MITVLLAVDDPLLRIGLSTVVEHADDCSLLGFVEEGADVREAVDRLRPHVLLMSVGHRRRDESLVPSVARDHPECNILILVDHTHDDCVLSCLGDGAESLHLSDQALEMLDECCLVSLRLSARGCLYKGSQPDQVLEAIRAVASGEIAAAPWLAALFSPRAHGGAVRLSDEQPVTLRELEVVAHVAEGLSNKEIARRLGIREQTVKNHLGRIMRKLGLGSRLEIGLFALKHNVTIRRPEIPGSPSRAGEA